MKTFAHVGQRDLLRRRVDIYIGEELDQYGQVRLLHGDVWSVVPEGEASEPTLTVTEAHARALLESLTTYFAGTQSTRALRKDYDDERARVDTLTTALIEIAKTPPMVIER